MRTFLIKIFLFVTVMALPCLGQGFGEITGVVADASGAVVPAATVTVTNTQTNVARQSTSNAAGVFNFPALLPGVYNVRAEIQGFRASVVNNVELQIQQVARVDFQLSLGSLTETVEVSATAAMLNTENASVGSVIENRRIVELPLNGRNFIALVALSPNVSANYASAGNGGDRQGGDRATQQISIGGQRGEFNNYTLDGITNTDVNFNTYSFLPSIDALQEFKVQTGIYSAEFGRGVGQVNVTTKSGTNQYHGALFEFLRNNSLDARPYAFTSVVPAKSPLRWNQFGFTLGGPIQIPKVFNGKDRLFFMSNYEGFRLRQQAQTLFSVAPAAMRVGNFSQIPTQIRDPLTGSPFTNNQIPVDRLHPTSIAMLEFMPLPNVPGAGVANNYLGLLGNSTNKDQFTQRIDFAESANSTWFGRYSWSDEGTISPGLKLNGSTLSVRAKQALLGNTRVLTPAMVNEFRFGYVGLVNDVNRELAFKRDVVAELNIPGLPRAASPAFWGSPNMNILNFTQIGDNPEGPFINNNHVFQWIDTFSWTKGSHSIKFGGEVRRDRYNSAGNYAPKGNFVIQDQATGYSMADFMLGYLRITRAAASVANVQFRATSQAYFINDTWKIRPNLTLDLSLRYEYTPPYVDRNRRVVNASVPFIDQVANVLDISRHPTLVRAGEGGFYDDAPIRYNTDVQVARDGRLGDRLVADDKLDFAPRIGLAWSPSSKWTIRAGAGMFYVQDIGNGRFDMGRNLAGRLEINSNIQTFNLTFDNPYLVGPTNPCNAAPPLNCVNLPFVLANQYGRRTPYAIQYLVNIQRQLSSSTVLEIGYLGSQAHQLEAFANLNQPLPGTTDIVTRRPWPELGVVQSIRSIGNSNYHAGSVKLSQRMSRGITYMAGYTYSKSIDNGSGGISEVGGNAIQDFYCTACSRSLSSFDNRHRFVSSILWALPFGKGQRFLNQGIASTVLGGWQASTIFTATSGFPFTVTSGSDRPNVGTGQIRPNATGQTAKLEDDQRGPNRWFNTQAFQLQPLGQFGNVGRNTVIGPGLVNWDFSILKNFAFTESKYLQFRFEAFNFANNPNWREPNAVLSNSTLDASGIPILGTGGFGRITATRTEMRRIQLALKFVF